MNRFHKTGLALAAAGALLALYQTQEVSALRGQVRALERERAQSPALRRRVEELRRQRDAATNGLAALAAENAALNQSPTEVLKLRGTAGLLRQEKAELGSRSMGGKLLADPATRELIRQNSKRDLSRLYRGFARQAGLTPEQTEHFTDLLADDAVTEADLVAALLRDPPPLDEIDRRLTRQETAMQQKIRDLLGPEALAQYEAYTRNLIGSAGATEFKGQLAGTDEAKAAKAEQLAQALRDSAQAALADAGLPPDFQTVPEQNSRSIASAQGCERSLKLLDDILQRTAARAAAFLSPEELAKFEKYRTSSLTDLKTRLSVARTAMAPITQ